MEISKPAQPGGFFYSVAIRSFRLLDRHYGDLEWWPGETPFEVMVGAILTQNTAWANVEKGIRTLKERRLLSLSALRRASFRRIALCIRPTGYFNQKTLKLKNYIRFLDSEYGGSLARMARQEVPVLRERLLSVKGIGPETADSILLYALDKPVFVVDAYTRRIFGRLGALCGKEGYEDIRLLFETAIKNYINQRIGRGRKASLDALTRRYNQFHACIVMAGKEFCRKRQPACASCPLKRMKRCARVATCLFRPS